jgi:Flp pilus assembly protein TadD
MRMTRHCLSSLLACGLAACATSTVPPQAALPPLTTASPVQMVAAIRTAAGDGEGELAVQPLRDPEVEDLREDAQRLEARQDYAGAAEALDRAIAIVPDDPALLQERAEVALLDGDPAIAGALAERAHKLGGQVGPLCRRHWATIEQVRLLARDADGAVAAKAQVEACTLAPPPRY